SEKWTSDSGSTSSVTNDKSLMYDLRDAEANREFIQIGDKGMIPVLGVGSINMRFHMYDGDGNVKNCDVQLKDVLYVPQMGFNLFSSWKASNRQTVILDPEG
ncbi:unnamed protein product, partial [Scytosiphon promiscuus]